MCGVTPLKVMAAEEEITVISLDEDLSVIDVSEKVVDDDESESESEAIVSGVAVEEERKGLEKIAARLDEELTLELQLSEYYSESDVVMMAQLIDIEAGAVWPLCRRAAVAWTVCNRLDNGRWGPETIQGIIKQPGQYAYYSGRHYSHTNYEIAKDVLGRWALEKISKERNSGRILPEAFESFWGDGSQNHFYDSKGNYWDYSVGFDPYENWE